MMDLGGPKLRTGAIMPGPEVIRIRPSKNVLGQVVAPAKLWLAPPDAEPPKETPNTIIPVNGDWLKTVKRESEILFTDSRNKKCKIIIQGREGKGRWGVCYDSSYLTTGTSLTLKRTKKKSGEEIVKIGVLLPLEQFISLHVDDTLILNKGNCLPGSIQ
jgi:pyruvate kinase